MNKTKRILVAIMAVLAVMSANAQFKYGLRAGTEINTLKMDLSSFSASNRAGFCAGPMIEFTIPVVNLGFDLSAMYVHRTSQGNGVTVDGQTVSIDTKSDYIEVPLNLKYKLNLPVVGKFLAPYIAAGPSLSILCSKKAMENFVHDRTCDLAINVGIGVEIANHVQIGASYGFGLDKAVQYVPDNVTDQLGGIGSEPIEGKNSYWTITAAYLF